MAMIMGVWVSEWVLARLVKQREPRARYRRCHASSSRRVSRRNYHRRNGIPSSRDIPPEPPHQIGKSRKARCDEAGIVDPDGIVRRQAEDQRRHGDAMIHV